MFVRFSRNDQYGSPALEDCAGPNFQAEGSSDRVEADHAAPGLDCVEERLILTRRPSVRAQSSSPAYAEFDPVSEDVLRRYRAYAEELVMLGPAAPTS